MEETLLNILAFIAGVTTMLVGVMVGLFIAYKLMDK